MLVKIFLFNLHIYNLGYRYLLHSNNGNIEECTRSYNYTPYNDKAFSISPFMPFKDYRSYESQEANMPYSLLKGIYNGNSIEDILFRDLLKKSNRLFKNNIAFILNVIIRK